MEGFDWAGLAGSALGAVGSIGGGMASAGSSSDGFSKKGFGQWLAAQDANAEKLGDIDARKILAMSKKARIHPLALVGINPSSGPVISGQSGDNYGIGRGIEEAFQGMGQDIKDSRLRQSTQMARDLDNLETTIRIRNEELRGQYLEEDLRRLKNPPSPDPTPIGGLQVTPKQVIAKSSAGTEVGHEAKDRWAEDSRGRFHRIPAESVAEAQESSLSTQLKFTAMDVLDYLGGLGYNINPSMKLKMDRLGPKGQGNNPPSGYRWVYVPFAGAYALAPVKTLKSRKHSTRSNYSRSNKYKRKYLNRLRSW